MPKTEEEVLLSLQNSRDNTLNLIEAITFNPKPNYDIDGQKIDWADYLKLLESSLEVIEAQIDRYSLPIEGLEQGYC